MISLDIRTIGCILQENQRMITIFTSPNPRSGKTQVHGYRMVITEEQRNAWANRPNLRWPNALLRGPITIEADKKGLIAIEPSAIPSLAELEALVSDHLPPELRHLWPTYERNQ